ncbi:hypothetical protein [Bacillus haynesii]|uniref:hypothetical protein n=1 Tax=Bacillus haynesii TaxID=1925021 RepID=UPI00398F99BE
MTVKKAVTFVRTSKHLHTQKAADHIIQILKPVPHAHCLSTVQDQRTARKSSLGMYGKTAKSFVRYRENGILGEQVLLTAACQNMKKIPAYLAKQSQVCGSSFSATGMETPLKTNGIFYMMDSINENGYT